MIKGMIPICWLQNLRLTVGPVSWSAWHKKKKLSKQIDDFINAMFSLPKRFYRWTHRKCSRRLCSIRAPAWKIVLCPSPALMSLCYHILGLSQQQNAGCNNRNSLPNLYTSLMHNNVKFPMIVTHLFKIDSQNDIRTSELFEWQAKNIHQVRLIYLSSERCMTLHLPRSNFYFLGRCAPSLPMLLWIEA